MQADRLSLLVSAINLLHLASECSSARDAARLRRIAIELGKLLRPTEAEEGLS